MNDIDEVNMVYDEDWRDDAASVVLIVFRVLMPLILKRNDNIVEERNRE